MPSLPMRLPLAALLLTYLAGCGIIEGSAPDQRVANDPRFVRAAKAYYSQNATSPDPRCDQPYISFFRETRLVTAASALQTFTVRATFDWEAVALQAGEPACKGQETRNFQVMRSTTGPVIQWMSGPR